MIRVIIADDHPVVRAGIKQVLSESAEIQVTAEMGSGEALIEEVRKNDYDVVLLDITMPGIGGLETLKRLKALKPELPVLMLSVHSEDQFALRTMKAGRGRLPDQGERARGARQGYSPGGRRA